MADDAIRVGLIGAGSSAQRIHLPGLRLCRGVEVAAVCDPDEKAARSTGIADVYGDWRDLLARRDIDAVVIATPNFTHCELALAACAAGKHVLCEKPLALSAADAKSMLAAAQRSGRVHMAAFTYQFAPALRRLRALLDAGELGDIRTVRASYLMALSGHLLGWRSLKRHAGSGVLADIGSHLIHLVQHLAGPIATVSAASRRFRDDPQSDVEDWIASLVRFARGATGTLEVSRVCPGRGAAISEQMTIEVYGSRGSAVFATQDPWALQLCTGEDACDASRPMTRVALTDDGLKLPGSPRDVHADDPRWGYRYDEAFQFIENVRHRRVPSPSFLDGARCQLVMDAMLSSAESGRWIAVEQLPDLSETPR
jgi:predicted dehydrogenase